MEKDNSKPKSKKKINRPDRNCVVCRGTGKVKVPGGPDRNCWYCGSKRFNKI